MKRRLSRPSRRPLRSSVSLLTNLIPLSAVYSSVVFSRIWPGYAKLQITFPWQAHTHPRLRPAPQDAARLANQCWSLSTRLREVFGNLDGYWEVFDPTRKDESVSGSLANDIAEIYFDLQESLKLLRGAAGPSDVYWQWRFDFQGHWGRHATSALRVLLHVSIFA